MKMFLKLALNNKYDSDIDVIDQGENPDEVSKLLEKHNIQAFPSMIYGSEVMTGFQPSTLMNYLEKHIGKK
jgi:hypothetical protein